MNRLEATRPGLLNGSGNLNSRTGLRSDRPFCWITGKPGSGKSTLIKYIHDDSRLLQTLLCHNPGLCVFITSFFFYNESDGVPLQNSFLEFLRVTLYQILYQAKELIPVVLPVYQSIKRRRGSQFYDATWSRHKLEAAFSFLRTQRRIPAVLFILVDAFDKCGGNHQTEADFLLRFATTPLEGSIKVKVCATSRHLTAFATRFKPFLGFEIHHKTKYDIRNYIIARFDGNSNLAQMTISPRGQFLKTKLVDTIVLNAQGHFSWARDAVDDILVSVDNGDSLEELNSRLENLCPKRKKKIIPKLRLFIIERRSISNVSSHSLLIIESTKIGIRSASQGRVDGF